MTFYVYDALDTMMLTKEKKTKKNPRYGVYNKWFGIKKNTKILIRFILSPHKGKYKLNLKDFFFFLKKINNNSTIEKLRKICTMILEQAMLLSLTNRSQRKTMPLG